MRGTKQTSSSNRALVLRFAAFLAHVLNEQNATGCVELQAFAVYKKIMAALEAREAASEHARYEALIGRKLLGPGVSLEQAAETYFEQVLKRPLYLARDGHWHKGHELFLALCRRGLHSPWRTAELQRSGERAQAVVTADLPLDIRGVFERLSKLEGSLSSGNPANSTRDLHGPLCLLVGGQTAEVAEEMSVWQAICCAPLQLEPLSGAAFHAFCSAMIKAVETANAHYGVLLSLGLSPLDWHDLSLNTAKKTSAFLSRVQEHAQRTSRASEDWEVWDEVWETHSVPGFPSARQLWQSELGQALRSSQLPAWASGDVAEHVGVPSGEEKVLDAVSFERMVVLAEEAGVIRSCDGRMLVNLFLERRTADQIASGAEAEELLGAGVTPSKRAVIDHLRKLVSQVRAHADKVQLRPRVVCRPRSIPIIKDRQPAVE
jgi:hypothetical protein